LKAYRNPGKGPGKSLLKKGLPEGKALPSTSLQGYLRNRRKVTRKKGGPGDRVKCAFLTGGQNSPKTEKGNPEKKGKKERARNCGHPIVPAGESSSPVGVEREPTRKKGFKGSRPSD